MRASTLRVLVLVVLLPIGALNGGCAAAALPLLMMFVKTDPTHVTPAQPATAPALPAPVTPAPAAPGEPPGPVRS